MELVVNMYCKCCGEYFEVEKDDVVELKNDFYVVAHHSCGVLIKLTDYELDTLHLLYDESYYE